MVGVLLAMAMLVAPAATATLLVRRLPWIMALGTAIGIAAVVVGLYISFHFDVATGPSIALTAVTFFAIAFVLSPRGLGAGWARRDVSASHRH
jgi:ABC-type Mn2+/Zn2+ transport system permease subunit